MKYINSEKLAEILRKKLVKMDEKKVLIAQLNESEEAKDVYTDINCGGYGRIRSFSKYSFHLRNALKGKNTPIKPLLRGCEKNNSIFSHAFQIAGCNWACWYCFVDKSRRIASCKNGKFFSAEQILDMHIGDAGNSNIIDLTGGQPDLVPEWVLWMMEAIEKKGLRGKIFIWVDDNLSSYNFWKFLSREQIEYMKMFPRHSRTGCFKGYDAESFSFNTKAHPDLFRRQFKIFDSFIKEGFDMYAYATFTGMPIHNIDKIMRIFVDELQKIHYYLPLRTIPLKVSLFSVNKKKISHEYLVAIEFQYTAYEVWHNELLKRFRQYELEIPYEKISLN